MIHEDTLISLYGSDRIEEEKSRYASLIEGMSFQGDVLEDKLRIFSAPGRTELGGNHTDHNRGRVLAASIQLDALAVVIPRNDRRVFFRSAGFPDVHVNLDGPDSLPDLAPKPEEKGTTEAIVRGIAAEFANRGMITGGFFANASSTVYAGSGLSSSAAVELLLAKIFDSLYNNGNCSALELAQICQKAENNYFGKPCGLMDQAASAFGGTVAIDFADPASPAVTAIQFDPFAQGYALCVVNTWSSHVDLTPDYAAIPEEMSAIARHFNKSCLREVELAQVLADAADLRKKAGDRALLRAIHFFNDDRRAGEMAELLLKQESGFMERFLTLVNESGDSSWELLQNLYSSQNPREQGLALALAVSREFFRENSLQAACRVHGGGFAGTIQAYIPLDSLNDYRVRMESLFGPGALTSLRIRPAGAVELE